jgi:NAD(P)H-quinone oxidoreductase subunit 4
LLMVNRVFFGRLTPQLAQIPRSTWPERFPAMVLALIIISIGIVPQWFIQWSEPQAAALLLGNAEIAIADIPPTRDSTPP